MSKEALDLRPDEPEDEDLLSLLIWSILSTALQPDSKIPIEETVARLTSLLPEGDLSAAEVGTFCMTCYDIAEQVPNDHPSMVKLVTILSLCLKSSRFSVPDDSYDARNGDLWRYATLSTTLRGAWNTAPHPDEKTVRYINYQTFLAHTDAFGLGATSSFGIWTLAEAFEGSDSRSKPIEAQQGCNACTMAALQHLVIAGEAIHQKIIDEGKPERWCRWHEQVSAIVAGKKAQIDEKSGWKHWLKQLHGAATSEKTCDEAKCAYPTEIVQSARSALLAMEAIEPCKPLKAG